MKIIRYLLPFILFAVFVSVVTAGGENSIAGNFLSAYVEDENGLQLYDKTDDGVVKSKKLNLGKFYSDVLKVNGNQDIIQECMNSDDYKACVDQKYEENERLQRKYEQHIRNINRSIEISSRYGMDYGSVPFIQDLLRG